MKRIFIPFMGVSMMFLLALPRLSDGVRFRSCPYYPVLQPTTATLSVAPTMVSSSSAAPIRIRSAQKSEARLFYQTKAAA